MPGVVALVALLCLPLSAGLTAEQRSRNLESFDYVWKTIRDKHWSMPAGLDWNKVRDELRPKVEQAANTDQARAAMLDMIGRLKQTHFNIVPQDVSEVLGDAFKSEHSGEGDPGLDVRIIANQAVIVSVAKGSPADQAGIRPGWVLRKADAVEIEPMLKRISSAIVEPRTRGLMLSRAVLFLMQRSSGTIIHLEFLDGDNRLVRKDVSTADPKGVPVQFGYMPQMHVWFEAAKRDNIGYARWNLFMDPPMIMSRFGDAIETCKACDGFVIDLRGNPGGLGAMAMGMAGWFVSQPGQKLGVMKTRDNELKFVVFPRSEVFAKPLAIVVDEGTASTSEIFAEGLKDLGRARIFGAPTAGAALPSVFEKLPNGDGFQYAIANYISEGGEPLEGLGVTPDVEVKLTRKALLAGHDPALEAAFDWVREQRKSK